MVHQRKRVETHDERRGRSPEMEEEFLVGEERKIFQDP